MWSAPGTTSTLASARGTKGSPKSMPRKVAQMAVRPDSQRTRFHPHSFALKRHGTFGSDFIVAEQGTIWTFYPRSRAAEDWWAANIEDAPWLGRNNVVE